MKFHKKYIKALKEGKLAMIDADKYPEIAQRVLDKAFPSDKIQLSRYKDEPMLYIEAKDEFWIIEDTTDLPTKSAKDFIKPSIETLTENDVVWCKNDKQREKICELIHGKVTAMYTIAVGTRKEMKRDYPGANIIPYRDLFPKKKKKLSKRNIKAQIKELAEAYINIKYRLDDIHPESRYKDYTLVRANEELKLSLERRLKQPKTDAIDWHKPGYYIETTGIVVLSDGSHNDKNFGGIVIKTNSLLFPIGYYMDSWGKDIFKPCTEDITIKIKY